MIPGDFFHVKVLVQLNDNVNDYLGLKIKVLKSAMQKKNENTIKSSENEQNNSFIDAYLTEAEKLDKNFGKNSHLFSGIYLFENKII